MQLIIEGFEEDIEKRLRDIMQDALSKGMEEVVFWSKLMAIKAEIIIDGYTIIIRKENDNE